MFWGIFGNFWVLLGTLGMILHCILSILYPYCLDIVLILEEGHKEERKGTQEGKKECRIM